MSRIGILGIAVGLGVWVMAVIMVTVTLILSTTPKSEVTCHTFHVGTTNEFGLTYIGQVELCGESMNWSTIWGPIGAEKPKATESQATPNPEFQLDKSV